MKSLIIENTPNTPKVEFLADRGVLKLEGRSIPENPEEFYVKLIKWLKKYYKKRKGDTFFYISYEYINSGSTKSLLELLKLVNDFHEQGKTTAVKWFYEEEDESIFELGEHIRDSIMLHMEISPLKQ